MWVKLAKFLAMSSNMLNIIASARVERAGKHGRGRSNRVSGSECQLYTRDLCVLTNLLVPGSFRGFWTILHKISVQLSPTLHLHLTTISTYRHHAKAIIVLPP